MPDAAGNFKGISVPAAAWDRVFAPRDTEPRCHCVGDYCVAKAGDVAWPCPRRDGRR